MALKKRKKENEVFQIYLKDRWEYYNDQDVRSKELYLDVLQKEKRSVSTVARSSNMNYTQIYACAPELWHRMFLNITFCDTSHVPFPKKRFGNTNYKKRFSYKK